MMHTLTTTFFCILLICFTSPLYSEENAGSEELTEEEIESSGEVKIQGSDNQLINEFRINGQLYMIRITPKKGAAYYLVDSDGDGDLETRWNELAPDLLIPSWVLLRW